MMYAEKRLSHLIIPKKKSVHVSLTDFIIPKIGSSLGSNGSINPKN